MRKILMLCLAAAAANSFAVSSTESAPATDYSAFQQFDRQYNIGMAAVSGNLGNGSTSGVYNSQYINLEVERLFDMGLWVDANASLVTYYSQSQDPNFSSSVTGSQPNFGGLNIKVGYAFPLAADHIMLTPYGMIGRNTNLSTYSLEFNNGGNGNMTQDYFWTVGGGLRLEYRANDWVDFYLDQNAAYNASQSPTGPVAFTANTPFGQLPGTLTPTGNNDNYSYTTTLGAKFNLYKDFQLGAQAFYTSYYFSGQSGASATVAGIPVGSANAYVPTSAVGGMISVGLTY